MPTDKGWYRRLNALPNWRQVLSDTYVYRVKRRVRPIVIDGREFASVRHYQLYRRFSDTAPALAGKFELSGAWGGNAKVATANANANARRGVKNWGTHRRHVRNAALLVKFRDFCLPRKILRLTRTAILTRMQSRTPRVIHVDWTLHILREYLFLDNDDLSDVKWHYEITEKI